MKFIVLFLWMSMARAAILSALQAAPGPPMRGQLISDFICRKLITCLTFVDLAHNRAGARLSVHMMRLSGEYSQLPFVP
jgi:hypothetical protein